MNDEQHAELQTLERELAMEAAISDLECEGLRLKAGWHELGDLAEGDFAACGHRAARYLELIGMLERKPGNPNIVRVKEGQS